MVMVKMITYNVRGMHLLHGRVRLLSQFSQRSHSLLQFLPRVLSVALQSSLVHHRSQIGKHVFNDVGKSRLSKLVNHTDGNGRQLVRRDNQLGL